MSYKNKLLFRLAIGVIILVVSYIIAKEAGLLELLMVEFYVPIVPLLTVTLVMVLLGVGLFYVVESLRDLLFGCVGEPNFKYDEKNRRIFVRYTSTNFRIERAGEILRLRMFLQRDYLSRPLHVIETGGMSALPVDELIVGNSGSDEFETSKGQVLYFKRYWTGIMVMWEEVDNPWKIVVE